jgi:peptidoglycan hydrolase-like protein with peptidoglycan-binding domain
MGKYLTSLLILASSVFLFDEIYADEQVRKVQEELYKRHLFYANADGEESRALSAAIKRYQEKKGFAPTGVIDFETLASLGIVRPVPLVASTPVVVGYRGDVRGANGETLPSYPPFLWPKDERLSQFDPATIGQSYLELALANGGQHGLRRQRAAGEQVELINGADEKGTPFPITFELTRDRIGQIPGKRIATRQLLYPANDTYWELGAVDEERVELAAAKSKGPSHRRMRRVRLHKETNPIILTYRSVDRAIRLLFSDTQPKRKHLASKRL